ncbi:hypothetical protein BGX26_009902 [Mortierella sp. AD094]|nr:hypothetical protein BGX26_009902 [Mortierella sp. AD094]
MSLLQSSKMSYAELSKRDSPLGGRRPTAITTTITTTTRHDTTDDDDSDYLEDMMTDSAIAGTPPLDLEFDSGDDNDYDDDDGYSELSSMRSPVSPPPSIQPVSILQHRKRKDSQEHLSAVHLLDRNLTSQQEELGHHLLLAPALDNSFNSKGGSARGRRPTVTFSLDEPSSSPPSSSPPAKLNMIQRPIINCIRFRQDDIAAVTVATAAPSAAVTDDNNGQDMTTTKESRQNDPAIQYAERALRRVSISLAEDDDDDEDNGQDQDKKVDNHDTDHNAAVAQSASQHASPNSNPNKSTTTTNTDINPPQEIFLNHILTEAVPQDMLVALFDRPSELEALVARHSDFFNLMYSSLHFKTNRDEYKKMLFQPREVLSDRDWMKAISEQLDSLPCILERFKDIVGWIGPDSSDDSEYGDDDGANGMLWGEDEYGCRDSSFENVQIKWFRDIQEEFPLETFQECYPQFFINAKECLEGKRMSYGGDQRDQYVIFCETLGLTREDLRCDSAWMRRMSGCLEKHPELMLQFKEIIAYEVDYDA